PVCCSFCFNQDVSLFEGGFDSTTRICGFCATRALAEITPQPVPEPPPPERPSKEARLASIPAPKTLVAHLDQYVIGQDIAKRRLALGVSNHFKRVVDTWDRDAPDPIIADADLHNVNRKVKHPADWSFRLGQDPPGQVPGFLSERPAGHRRCYLSDRSRVRRRRR